MKKYLASLLIALLLCTALPANAYDLSTKPVTVHVDGIYLASDVLPYIKKGRTLIPLRAGAEALGAKAEWNSQNKTATIKKDKDVIVFTAQQKTFTINGQRKALDVPLEIKKGRIMLPLRAFADSLKVDVKWNADLADVAIDTPKEDRVLYDPIGHSVLDWVAKKYYAPEDPEDPWSGNWICRYTFDEGYGRPTPYTNLDFVTKTGTNQYKIIKAVYSDTPGQPALTISAMDARATGNGFLITGADTILYYQGPPRGFTGENSYTFMKKDGAYVQIKMRNSLGTTNTDNDQFYYGLF